MSLNLPGWFCSKCGVFNGEAKETLHECRGCPDGRRLQSIRDHANATQQLKQEQRERAGLCVRCGKPVSVRSDGTRRTMCETHAQAEAERSKKRRKSRAEWL